MRTEDVTDEECIRHVLARFIQLRDDKYFEEWVQLFTEDGVFEYGSNVLVGWTIIRENVEELLREDRGKHLCLNSVIDVEGDSARVSSDFVKVNPGEEIGATSYEIVVMGRYHDQFVKKNGAWKIASRRVLF
jgi:3-phenylpropionate/cinnamic acid dioxygenase small subunit